MGISAVLFLVLVPDVLHEFDRIGEKPLWPGFEPRRVALEVYDGTSTYLYRHPKPPEGFRPVEGKPELFVFTGKHDSVRANTGTELNGVPTATADLSKGGSLPAAVALLIHESFHVYQKAAHPTWTANEAELFVYPFADAHTLAQRRVETLALVRALGAKEEPDRRCWIRASLDARRERFAAMPEGAVGYERGIELTEGLAQYVEGLSIGAAPELKERDYPAEQIRQRAYATGQAWALLLDRVSGDWKTKFSEASLDEALAARARVPVEEEKRCAASKEEVAQANARATKDVAEIVASREKRRSEYLGAAGWRLEVVTGAEPLWPQGFDPLNVVNLGESRVLHTRWLKLGNGAGTMEVLDRASLTEGAGPHPLFNGAKRLVVTGLSAEPVLVEKEGQISFDLSGLKGSFRGRVEKDGQRMRIVLP